MNPGQKMYDENGNQICLFPLQFLNISQWYGPDTLSHCCGCAVDYRTHGEITPVYAPFDCHLVYNSGTTAHTLFYCSDRPVRTPSGLHYVSIQLTHAHNPPYTQNVKQGDIIYYSGNAGGWSMGIHLHMDQTFDKDARWMNYNIKCNYGNTCYGMPDPVPANDVFYVNDTTIEDDKGHTFVIYEGPEPPTPPTPPTPPGPGPSGGQFKWWLAHKMLFNRRNM